MIAATVIGDRPMVEAVVVCMATKTIEWSMGSHSPCMVISLVEEAKLATR